MAKAQRTYSAEKKAQVQLAIVIGQVTKEASLQEIADRFDIPKPTIQTWWEEVRDRIPDVVNIQAETFDDVLAETAKGLTRAHYAALSPVFDPDWVKNKYATAGGHAEVLNLIVTLTNSLVAIAKATGAVNGSTSALPAYASGSDAIIPELVDG